MSLLKRGAFLLILFSLVYSVSSLTVSEPVAGTRERINFQCEDGTWYGNCNANNEICANGENLILNSRVNLEENKRYVFFGFVNESCNNYKLNLGDFNFKLSLTRPNGRKRVIADFLIPENYIGRISVKCSDNREIEVENKYLGTFSGAGLYRDCNVCGNCVELSLNQKNPNMYNEKQVFLISNRDWKHVVQLVPLTTWTVPEGHPDLEWCNILKNEDGTVRTFNENGIVNYVCGYPTLIYHEEENGFDADSIIYFMQQYNTEKVIIIGETPKELDNLLVAERDFGAGLSEENIERVNINDFLFYWNNYESVVYVEDNYELSLIASSYASLINAPLIIENGRLDYGGIFVNKNVICVGNVNKHCDERYNLEELQKKYVDLTKTDKIILVNPSDLDIKVEEEFNPEKSRGSINEIYSRTSLVAPILASSKHEIILSIKLDPLENDSNQPDIINRVHVIDNYLSQRITSLNISQGYLTIIASPDAIEGRYYSTLFEGRSELFIVNADTARYSSHDEDPIIEFATGRIFGISISDISGYVSRSVFNNQIHTGERILLLAGDFAPEIVETVAYKEKVYPFYNYLSEDVIEYNDCCPHPNPDLYKNKMLIQYRDHAYFSWLGITSENIPNLDNTFFMASGCSTCIYYDYKHPDLFCSQAIRKGASGYIGMFTGGGLFLNYQYMISALTNNIPLGDIWKGAMISQGYGISWNLADISYNNWGFIGDPTLILRFPYQFPTSELIKIDDENYKINLKITKVPLEFNYKHQELNLDTYISSPYDFDNKMYLYTFIGGLLEGGATFSDVNFRGVIKIGPIEKGYSTIHFSNPSIISEIIEREDYDENKEILWIRISTAGNTKPEDFYPIDTTNGRFINYELDFSIER